MIYLLDVAKIVTIPLISKALGLPRAICYSGLHFGPCKIRYSEEIAGFLCIKAMQGIEKFEGYDLETVLNSMFCYRLPKRAPDSEPVC